MTSKPEKADVYLDDDYFAKTPFKREIDFPGKDPRKVKVKKDGYKDFVFNMKYFPKDTNKYEVILEKEEVVKTELVNFEPLQTNEGVKLQRKVKSTLAYLSTIERSPQVKSPQKITNNEKKTEQIGGPVISPNGNRVAYRRFQIDKEDRGNIEEIMERGLSKYEGGFSNIWVQPVDAYNRTRITFGQNMDLYPTFTPDGKQILFSSNRITENPTIWQVNTKGSGGLTSITNTKADDFAPSMFPNNKILTYTSLPPRADQPQIWKIKQSGTLPTQLRVGQFPDVSPDGNKIVFVREDNTTEVLRERDSVKFNPKQLWKMNEDGSGQTQLTQNVEYNCKSPKWSPDGKWIVYVSDEGKDNKGRNNYDIWMMRTNGTQKIQLTTNGSRDDRPTWSPDGEYIYFRSNRGGYWNIWRFKPVMPDN